MGRSYTLHMNITSFVLPTDLSFLVSPSTIKIVLFVFFALVALVSLALVYHWMRYAYRGNSPITMPIVYFTGVGIISFWMMSVFVLYTNSL
jgi:hypothetical protein